jgi:hypothetical protein
MSAPDIFFSYAREDQARLAPVVAAVEARGWSVFWDQRIRGGQVWRSHIDSALDQARCVVVAWSEHSIRSWWVIEEAAEGRERQILVPILLDPVRPPFGFRGIQAIDLSGWSAERPLPAFDHFLADLGAMLGTARPGSPPALSAAEVPPAEQILSDSDGSAPHRVISGPIQRGRWMAALAGSLLLFAITGGGFFYFWVEHLRPVSPSAGSLTAAVPSSAGDQLAREQYKLFLHTQRARSEVEQVVAALKAAGYKSVSGPDANANRPAAAVDYSTRGNDYSREAQNIANLINTTINSNLQPRPDSAVPPGYFGIWF